MVRVLRADGSMLLLSSTGAAVTVSMRIIAMQTTAAIVLRPAIKVTHKISLYCSVGNLCRRQRGFDSNFSKIVFVGCASDKSFTRIDKDLLGKVNRFPFQDYPTEPLVKSAIIFGH